MSFTTPGPSAQLYWAPRPQLSAPVHFNGNQHLPTSGTSSCPWHLSPTHYQGQHSSLPTPASSMHLVPISELPLPHLPTNANTALCTITTQKLLPWTPSGSTLITCTVETLGITFSTDPSSKFSHKLTSTKEYSCKYNQHYNSRPCKLTKDSHNART